MPKTQKKESVLRDWVTELTFQMQALLLTAMRGPDAMQKENTAKCIIRYLRGTVIKPVGNWTGFNDNSFMWGEYDLFHQYCRALLNDHDAYPHHFLMHLIHSAEVIGYLHHDSCIRSKWITFYYWCCDEFHMSVETRQDMEERLNDFGEGFIE